MVLTCSGQKWRMCICDLHLGELEAQLRWLLLREKLDNFGRLERLADRSLHGLPSQKACIEAIRR